MTGSAADKVARLDRALQRAGEDVVLRRVVGATNQALIDAPVRALVRGFKPAELVGGIIQGDSLAIISPTGIEAAQWPGGHAPQAADARVPVRNDKLIVQGRTRNIEAAAPIYVDGTLVRIELQLRG